MRLGAIDRSPAVSALALHLFLVVAVALPLAFDLAVTLPEFLLVLPVVAVGAPSPVPATVKIEVALPTLVAPAAFAAFVLVRVGQGRSCSNVAQATINAYRMASAPAAVGR